MMAPAGSLSSLRTLPGETMATWSRSAPGELLPYTSYLPSQGSSRFYPPPEPVQHEEDMEKVLPSLVLLPKPNLTTDQVDPASCSDPVPHHCHQHPGHGGCRWDFLLGPPHKPGLHDSSSAPFLDLPVAQRQSPGHWCCLPEPEEAQDIAQLRKAWKLQGHQGGLFK